MSDLVARMRAAREHWIPLEGKKAICVLRPRFEDLASLTGIKVPSAFVGRFAVGWKGFTEADFLPSGGALEVEFDPVVCAEWMADNPGPADTVSGWLLQAAQERANREVESRKNSKSSSDGSAPPTATAS